MKLKLAWAGPDGQGEIDLELAEPVTVKAAIDAACVMLPELSQVFSKSAAVGVWGKVRPPEHLLRDGDRVEIYRELKADPKDARRAKAESSVRKTGKM